MKIKSTRGVFSFLIIFAFVIGVVSVTKDSKAAQLSNISYSYYNDGDMGENALKVSINGKRITIKAGTIERNKGSKYKTIKKFKKTFKITSKLSRYYCLTGDKFTGEVNAKKFKKDLYKVKNHTYGSIRFYVKGNKIVGYEIYG